MVISHEMVFYGKCLNGDGSRRLSECRGPSGRDSGDLTVFQGEVTLRVNAEEYCVASPDAIRFRADRPHVYHNSGQGLAKVSMVIDPRCC